MRSSKPRRRWVRKGSCGLQGATRCARRFSASSPTRWSSSCRARLVRGTATRSCSSVMRRPTRSSSQGGFATRSASASVRAIPKSSRSAGFSDFRGSRETRKPAKSHPRTMRAQHYDMVLNGYELGSGSIRNHDPALQRRIFRMLGMGDEEIEERFGFFIRALDYGAPPHGGMALGIDRIAMIACGETSIRDVIAFPKNQVARDLMMDAPSAVPEKSLRELGLAIKSPAKT